MCRCALCIVSLVIGVVNALRTIPLLSNVEILDYVNRVSTKPIVELVDYTDV